MKIHKIRTEYGAFTFTVCSIPLHLKGGQATHNWDNVDCRNCLKKRIYPITNSENK